MALIKSTAIPSGATDYELEQSLRFNDDDSAYLSTTLGTATHNDRATFSCWTKRGNLSDNDKLITRYTDANNRFYIGFNTDNNLLVYSKLSSSTVIALYSTAQFRDTSSWYHILVAMDTGQGTAANRVKVYVNGSQITDFGTETYPSQNQDLVIQSATSTPLTIGSYDPTSTAQFYDGYMTEMNFVDGQQLTPADFGETGDYGEWKPKAYSGTYGTNGFYLPFKQDYTVEGFSAVTYKGNSSNRYLGGFGFQPDLIWQKTRDYGYGHQIVDSVRGTSKEFYEISSASSGVEADSTTGLTGFKPDGVTLGTGNGWNNSARTQVIWAWDMGSPAPKMVTSSGVQTDTGDKKFGVSSARLINGQSDRLTVPTSDDWNLLSKTNYTIDFWVKHRTTINSDEVYVSQTEGSYANSWYFRAVSGGEVNFTAWDAGTNIVSVRTGAGVVTTDNWHHVALVKSGNTYKIFIDGTDETDSGGTDSSTWSSSTAELRIGDNGSGQWLDAFIDEIRLSDVARYSSNFTPATNAYTRDANTLLLLHMDGANNSSVFLDHSGMDVNTDGSITSNVKASTTYGQSIVTWTGNATAGASVGTGLSSAAELIIIKNRETAGAYWRVHDNISGKTNGRMDLNGNGAENTANHQITFQSDKWTFNSDSGQHEDWNKNNTNMLAYCFHSVTGYSKIGSYTGNGSNTGTVVTTGFRPAFLLLKNTEAAGSWYIYDSVRDPADKKGQALWANNSNANTTFYERLKFTDSGFQLLHTDTDMNGNGTTYIYMAFADKREYAYWLDQSGNNNDWTSNNLTESAISVDSPTNNFATWNPLSSIVLPTLSEGNLKSGGENNKAMAGTFGVSTGKWYWEINVLNNSQIAPSLGVTKFNMENDPDVSPTLSATSGRSIYRFRATPLYKNFTATAYADDSAHGLANYGILGLALDLDNGTIKYYVNNTLYHTDSTIPTDGTILYPLLTETYSGGSGWNTTVANFGQDSSFAGNKTAQGNQDGNDIGDFYYTPPTGYLALCTKNLPDVTVTPSEHFNTVLYTGTGNAQSITGVGFQPDFVWGKKRGEAGWHHLFDAIRGVGEALFTNDTTAEDTSSQSLTSFNVDGFSLGTAGGLNGDSPPVTGVAWNWKANGSGSSNTNGDITSTVSANVDAGFSIVSYTGNGTANQTVGHGLSKTPEIIIIKGRENATFWSVISPRRVSTSNTNMLYINVTNAEADDTNVMGDNLPTATTFGVDDYEGVNVNNLGFIAYCFHSVDGYSKVGSYTGNGNVNGTFVYTGFRPAWVMWKKTNAAGTIWQIFDSVRNTSNPVDNYVSANSGGAESNYDFVDFTSNGFKHRHSSGHANGSGDTYIYLAFAETPFKYSNAR